MGEKRSRSIDEVLARLDRPRRTGDKRWSARCPAHDDSSPSLSVGVGDRGITLKCHAGCSFEAIAEAIGFGPEELFDDDPYEKGARGHVGDRRPSSAAPKPKKPPASGCTLAELAEAKGLPLDHLVFFGARDTIWHGMKAVAFAYARRDGTLGRTHIRKAVGDAEKKWAWADDAPAESIFAYDPNRGELARHAKQLVIVEGEVDVLTLLLAGFGALGIPGANASSKLEKEHVDGVEHVFVVQENDASGAGKRFAVDVRTRIEGALGFKGGVHVVTLPEGVKDTNELYLRDRVGFGNALQAMLDKVREPPPLSKSLLELIGTNVSDGVVFGTGFGELDRLLRPKGLPTGKAIVLIGAPGARKTSLAVQWADSFSRQGAAVLVYAGDEGRENMVTRIGQAMGFNRDALTSPDAAGEAVRAEYMRREAELGRVLHIVDPDEEGEAHTLEQAHAELVRLARGRPRVLVIDSLQTLACEAADAFAGEPRLAINAKIATIRKLRKTGTLIVIVSEAGREFYATVPTPSELFSRTMKGGKESGDVEYKLDLVAGLFRVPGEENRDLVQLAIAKSRFGEQERVVRLRWDADRARFGELAPDEAEVHERTASATPVPPQTRAAEARDLELRDKVLEVVRCDPGIKRDDVAAALGKGRTKVRDAIASLLYHRSLREEQDPKTGAKRLFVSVAAREAP